jgi:LmbE family N-acetylglucosaminyl deacetylase
MRQLGNILGVWAHPDDEGYLSAGIMAHAVRNGRAVTCVTATRGEAADPERWAPADLAKIREAEMRDAMDILGITDHRWLDYADGECAAVDPEEGALRIATIIEELRPDTVLTFGPDGQTGHPDHIAVCDWTTRAVARSAPGIGLYYATNSEAWVARFEASGTAMGVMMGAEQLPRCPPEALAIHEILDDDLLDLKERAMCAQATQVADLRDALGAAAYRELLQEEAFRLP